MGTREGDRGRGRPREEKEEGESNNGRHRWVSVYANVALEHLGEASIKQAHGQKRKSVRVEDINSAIRATSSARFLEADFPITGPSDHKRTKLNDASLEQVVAGPMDSFLNASSNTASSEKEVVAGNAGNAVERTQEVVENR